ncbi:putative SH3 domain-containing kinase-binding protein [Naja naja]|nr:putative SH3 domain-containing kinase-binding protein [Naja naja]
MEGFDSIVPVAEKLSHPTTTRPKATGRRPPSQSFTSSSLSSPDFFDSPSPEDEKEEQISLPHKVTEPLKKAKTVTISLVSDNKASLPTKPGSLTSGSSLSSSLPSSSILHPASGHRSNSPLFSTEGKLKTDHSSQGEAALEELRSQVKELRTIIETMKDQQKNKTGNLEGFDSIVPVAEKLSHPTTTRPKATGRRPPSQSFTSSSLSSPDFFDSPSPEDEKEEQISLPHKVAEPLKKAKTVTISLVSDNKASLPTKPGSLTSGSSLSSSLPSSSILHPASGHRSNSPLFSTEGKLKTDHSSQGEAALEELRSQVKELRTIIETMKDQQKKEIKQLLSELDEEKRSGYGYRWKLMI